MPHWSEKHSLRALYKTLTKARTLVDELLKRRKATRAFNRNADGAMNEILSAVRKKPNHYTSRRLVAKFKKRFEKDTVLAAIDDLKEKGSIATTRKDGGKDKSGYYVLRPLHRKATRKERER
jgi:hypothetical protein